MATQQTLANCIASTDPPKKVRMSPTAELCLYDVREFLRDRPKQNKRQWYLDSCELQTKDFLGPSRGVVKEYALCVPEVYAVGDARAELLFEGHGKGACDVIYQRADDEGARRADVEPLAVHAEPLAREARDDRPVH